MRKIEFCGMKGCERWRVFGGAWSNKPFETDQDERLGWRVTTCPDHTEVSMVGTVGEYYDEEGKNDDVRPPIVLFCLHMEGESRCQKTSWYGMDDWSENPDRKEGMETGRYTSMMASGGFCSEHRSKTRKAS